MAVLIQIGGLGITSIGMGLALAAGRRISLRERTLIREAMNVSSLEGMVRLVRAIIKLTLAFELAGVIPHLCSVCAGLSTIEGAGFECVPLHLILQQRWHRYFRWRAQPDPLSG